MFFQEQRIYNEIIKGKEGKDLEEDGRRLFEGIDAEEDHEIYQYIRSRNLRFLEFRLVLTNKGSHFI